MTSSNNGNSAGLPVPAGWVDWSAYRFLAPDKKQVTGRLLPNQLSQIRGQLTVTWEELDESRSLEEVLAERPMPPGVTHQSEVEVSPTTVKRSYRFADPLRGWIIQRGETYIKDGARLYVVMLSASPLDFAACEAEISKSKKILSLLPEAMS